MGHLGCDTAVEQLETPGADSRWLFNLSRSSSEPPRLPSFNLQAAAGLSMPHHSEGTDIVAGLNSVLRRPLFVR